MRVTGGLRAALMQLQRGCRLEKWFPPQYNGDSVSQCCFRKGASSPGAFCAAPFLLRGCSEELLFKEPADYDLMLTLISDTGVM